MRGIAVLLVLAGACRPTVAIDAEAQIGYFAYLASDGRGSPIYSSERGVSLPNSELAGTLVFGWAAADFEPGLPSAEVMAAAPIAVTEDPCAGTLPPARLAKKLNDEGEAFDFPLSSAPTLSVAWLPRSCEFDGGVGDGGPGDRGVDAGASDAGTEDAETREVGVAPVQGRAFGLATTSAGLVATALIDQNEVRLADWPTLDFARVLPVQAQPTDVAFSVDGTRLAISHLVGQAIGLVTLPGGSARFVLVSDHPYRVIFGPDDLVYSSGEGPYLRRIDPTLAAITATLTISAQGNGLVLDPIGGGLFVGARRGGVQEVDLVGFQVRRTLAIPGRLADLVIDADRRLWVANEDGPIACWDLEADQPCEPIPLVGDGAFGLALSADGRELWASFPLQGDVAAFDPISRSQIRHLVLGGEPRRIRFSPDDREVWISNEDGHVYRVPR
jgi:DNA-binding beta-propeller fold protein YncE